MKKRLLVIPFLGIAILGLLIINSCKKENSQSADLTPQQEEEVASVSSQSEAETEFAFNDVFDNVMGANTEVAIGGTGVFGRSASGRGSGADTIHCFTVTVTRLSNTEPFPVRIVLDFGSGCTGRDGHVRYGKIITTYTGRLIVPGKSATTTFDGYRIDSISLQGTHVITNTTASNQRQFTVDVTNAKLSKPSGNYEEWESHRIVTQTEGNGTPDLAVDDIFSIRASAHGKVKKGDHLYAWQSETSEPLIKKFICPWIVKGVLRVRRETLSTNSQWVASLDYGLGDCDNKAILTINGVSSQIILH